MPPAEARTDLHLQECDNVNANEELPPHLKHLVQGRQPYMSNKYSVGGAGAGKQSNKYAVGGAGAGQQQVQSPAASLFKVSL